MSGGRPWINIYEAVVFAPYNIKAVLDNDGRGFAAVAKVAVYRFELQSEITTIAAAISGV